MKCAFLKVFMAVMILAAFGSTQTAMAAAKPKLPLNLGYYVPEGVNCPKPGAINPKEYAFKHYPESSIGFHGDGFSCNDGNMFWYFVNNVSKKGNIYKITGEAYTGVGAHNMGTFELFMTIENKTSFSITKAEGVAPLSQQLMDQKKKIYRFHYCGNPDNIKYPLK